MQVRVARIPPSRLNPTRSQFLFGFLRATTWRSACTIACAGTVMPDKTEGEAQTVAADIVRYLRAHPGAADTLEGVARWWLPQQPSERVMERAMAMLVSKKLVERHVLPEGTAVFRCCRCAGMTDD